MAVTKDGEAAGIEYYLDEDKIAEEARYDGLYAVCTDLLDDDVAPILRVSEGRWRIEECFRIMKSEFQARPVYLKLKDRIVAHFITCLHLPHRLQVPGTEAGQPVHRWPDH